VGIAAPQLGVNSRVFLMLKHTPLREDDLPDDGDDVKLTYQECINPEILERSSTLVKDFEGCLSVPGYVGVVKRAEEIKVQYNDAQGQRYMKTLRGFPARIFQHELDHLDGVLYIDRLEKDTLMHNDEFDVIDPARLAALLRD
jgi:peptide deformylase